MKNNFTKYRYLGSVIPETPVFWDTEILSMLKKIDKLVKPKLIPRWILNTLSDIAYRNGVIKNWYWANVLKMYSHNAFITQIKSKFATLRIYGEFSDDVQKIVSETQSICNNICENCGTTSTAHVMVKGWVKNLCINCIENIKNGTNDRSDSSN